jgi:hypothetical protein
LNSFDLSEEQGEKLTLNPPSILLYENGVSNGIETQLANFNMGFNQILENIELTVKQVNKYGVKEGLRRSSKRIMQSSKSSKKSNKMSKRRRSIQKKLNMITSKTHQEIV